MAFLSLRLAELTEHLVASRDDELEVSSAALLTENELFTVLSTEPVEEVQYLFHHLDVHSFL